MVYLKFILFYFAFVFTLTQLGALAGSTFLAGEIGIQPPSPPSNLLEVPGFFFNNIVYFFKLMSVSTPFTILGFILIILTVGLIWVLMSLIKDLIPFT